jgi:SlyX protein
MHNASADPRHPADAVNDRLTELEVKLSYSEDLLEQLNLTVYRQQTQIDALLAQIAQLRLLVVSAPGGGAARDPRDELPPHY